MITTWMLCVRNPCVSSWTHPCVLLDAPVCPLGRTRVSSWTHPCVLLDAPVCPLGRTRVSSWTHPCVLLDAPVCPLGGTRVSSWRHPCVLLDAPVCPLGRTRVSSWTHPCVLLEAPVCPLGRSLLGWCSLGLISVPSRWVARLQFNTSLRPFTLALVAQPVTNLDGLLRMDHYLWLLPRRILSPYGTCN